MSLTLFKGLHKKICVISELARKFMKYVIRKPLFSCCPPGGKPTMDRLPPGGQPVPGYPTPHPGYLHPRGATYPGWFILPPGGEDKPAGLSCPPPMILEQCLSRNFEIATNFSSLYKWNFSHNPDTPACCDINQLS